MAIRVLLCDDVESFRALVRGQLAADADIEVVGEAGDGEEGLAKAERLEPDVVVMDLSMPRCDGLQAIPRIRRAVPRTSIVALSGIGAQRVEQLVLDRGASAYLEKGVDGATICAAVRAAAGA